MVLSIIQKATDEFVSQQPKAKRKQYGQFFTTVPTAEFMASMFQIDTNRSSIRLLDAGAGAGILSAALVSHLRASGYKGRIILICYENNPDVLPVLKRRPWCAIISVAVSRSSSVSKHIVNDGFLGSSVSV